jgi:N-alpha-acetyltransferase 50
MSSSTTTKSRITFASLTPNNLGTVRKLNSVLFPVRYSERFYSEILQSDVEEFCKLGMSSFEDNTAFPA